MTADDAQRCRHVVGRGRGRRPCKVRAGADGYCGRHADHPERRIEERGAALHDYVDAAVRTLGQIVEHDDEHRPADVIKAAIAILDRTGHGSRQTVTIDASDARLEQLLTELHR